MPYIGRAATNAGSVNYLDDISSGFDGNDVTFTCAVKGTTITPGQENVYIYLDGVFQHPGESYTISGSTITFTEAPVSGVDFTAYVAGEGAYLDDGTVSTAKLDDDAVTASKLDDDGTGFQVGDLGVGGSLTSGDKLTVTGRLRASGGIIGDVTGDLTGDVTGDLTGNVTGNLTGNVTGNTSGTAATVTGATQSAITSVGTLTSLNVSGNAVISGSLQSDDITLDAGSGNPDLVIKTTATSSATAQALFLTGSHDFTLVNDTANFRLYNSTPGIGVDVIKVIGSSSDILFGDVGNSRHVSLDYSNGDFVVNKRLGVGAVPDSSYAGATIYGTSAIKTTSGDGSELRFKLYTGGAADASILQMFKADGSTIGVNLHSDGESYFKNSSHSVLALEAGTNSSASLRLRNDAQHWDVNCQTTDNFAIYDHTGGGSAFIIESGGYNATLYGNLTISNTGSSSSIDIDGNQGSGDDGRIYIKGHTSSNSRAFIYFNNGQTSGGQNWYLGALRGSQNFTLSTVDDYNSGTNVFAVDSGRRIGINTEPSSSYRVKISGTVYSDTTSQFVNTMIGTVTISGTSYGMIGSNSSSRGIAICRDGSASFPDFRINGDGTCRINNELTVGSGIINSGNLYSSASSGSHYCGLSNHRWHTVYGVNSNFSSDQTLKKNIKTSDLGIDFINSLNPVKFNWKKSFQDDTKNHYGFLAQEIVKTALADSVSGDEGEMGMNYSELIAPIVKAIQELSDKITALEGN